MYDTFKKIRDLLSPEERRGFYLLFGMMIVSGFVEMITVASIAPFLAIVARPSIIETNATVAGIYATLGFTDVQSFLVFIGGAVFVIVFFGLLFSTLTQYLMYRFTAMRAASIGRRVLQGYLRQPYSWFLNQHSAQLEATVLSEVGEVIQRGMLPLMKILTQATTSVFLIALLVAAQPSAAFTAAALIGGTYAVIYFVVRSRLGRLGGQRKRAMAEKYKAAGEALGGIKDVKLLGLEDAFLARFERPALRAASAVAAINVASEVPRNALRAITLGGILFFVVYLLLQNGGDLGDIVPILGLYAFAGIRLLPALQVIYWGMTNLRFAKPVIDKLHDDMMRLGPALAETGPAPAAGPPLRLDDRLELRDVRYAYPNAERGALQGLSLAIDARTTVGIVGGTGAGKTTAVDVLLGLLRPQEGALVVDGVEVTDDKVRSWQKSVGYVPQQIFLTDDTVAANIAFGVPPKAIDMAAVERAARIAEMHDFVTRELPEGYATTLGERGVRLSGGQRQRIGIARALYHDPDVLVLDEATSALDNLTERAVMDAVHNLGGKKTIVMIAHRLSTVRDCDRIFLLEQGRVVAQGSYDELVESNAEFRRLVSGGRG
jgi:ABC-type multidrug transport system fused ATPase/permease subunit